MAKCPYCQNEMKKGFIQGDGEQPLIWLEENQEKNFIQKIINNNCIVLEEAKMFHITRVSANYCDMCKKIIIDIK